MAKVLGYDLEYRGLFLRWSFGRTITDPRYSPWEWVLYLGPICLKKERDRQKLKGGALVLSWGEYGGFYYHHRDFSRRLCLGWVAFTYFPVDLDTIFRSATESEARLKARIVELEHTVDRAGQPVRGGGSRPQTNSPKT